ncbi:MAG TPA: hypothetical protein PKY82_35520 [Pyrinomonadaceae bacterium]|nr:hypothetical protein [Pyrinomonadaceae bacterium]
MSQNLKISEAFGIEIGDIIWGNYGNYEPTKYEVTRITKPALFNDYSLYIYIYSQPVIHIGARDIGSKGEGNASFGTIRQVGGRYFSSQNDEIFIEKPRQRAVLQRDLFALLEASEDPLQYPFQEGVDYRRGAGLVWNCEKCDRDFNTEFKMKLPCRHECGSTSTPIFYFDFPKTVTTDRYPSTFLVSLNFEDYLPNQNGTKSTVIGAKV